MHVAALECNGIEFLHDEQGIVIEAGIVRLEAGRPVVDGVRSADPGTAVESSGEQFSLQYRLGDGREFTLRAECDGEGLAVSYTLHLGDSERPPDSFGLAFGRVSGAARFYRSGYNSWDGSFYIELSVGEGQNPTGFAVSQLVPQDGGKTLLLGFDRHDRFQHTFTIGNEAAPSLSISTLWDEKTVDGSRECSSERLVLRVDQHPEKGLRDWAEVVASASVPPPRLADQRFVGWCSWYDLYSYINEEILLTTLHDTVTVVTDRSLPMWVFQIDDGFTPEMGDWLDVSCKFPKGMKRVLDESRKAHFRPGLWIAPFMVGNRSKLFHDHPDWVLHDRQTAQPKPFPPLHYGEYRWHKRSEEYYVLDATHPDAFAYLREVFRTWRRDWGVEYFKTDFMLYGSEWGPDEVLYTTPGKTRIEVWRQVAEMIREEIDDALWLGCGCPLWASIGLVDAVRIGGDVGVAWTGEQSAMSLLRDLPARNFANQVLWQVDPDCVLLRDRYHYLSDAEVCALAIFAAMAGGVMMTSDNLVELSEARLDLWQFLLSRGSFTPRYPLLGRSPSPFVVQVAERSDGIVMVHVLNASEERAARSLSLSELSINLAEPWFWQWPSGRPSERRSSARIALDPHASTLLFISPQPLSPPPLHLYD